MLQSGFWSPVTYDYGATGTRPPQNLGLQASLQLQDNQNRNQQELLARQFGFQGGQNALDRALQEATQGRQLGFAREQLGFQSSQNELDRALQERMQSAQLSNNLSIAGMPIEFAREKFNQVFPLVSGAIGGMGSGSGSGSAVAGGFERAPGTVYTSGQINQSVNAMKASNQQQAATQQRQNAAATSAGGFGSNSPLLAALNNQAAMGALQANTSGERETRLGAAAANAKQGLGAAQANNQARLQSEANAIDAQRNQLNARTSLLSALAGML